MAKQTINIGTAANSGNGDPVRTAFHKANENFTELYARAVFSGSYNDLTGKPTLFSGSYNDLTGKPTLFSGSYNDLTNKPTIPTSFSSLVNGSNTVSLGSNGTLTASGSIELKNTLRIQASDVDTLYDNYQGTLLVLEELFITTNYTGPGYPASKNSYDALIAAREANPSSVPSSLIPASTTVKNAYYSWAAATTTLTASAYGFHIQNGDGVGLRFEESTGLRFPDNTYQTTAFTGGFISLSTLKTVVAASTDFADFKTRIAAL
jgi:hypothetical protein